MAPSTPRVVVVSGASSGIGRAVAHRLAARGDHLVIASRGSGPLEEAAAECRQLGAGSVRTAVVDIRDGQAVDGLLSGAVTEHGRVDAVVNAAAVLAFGRFEDVPGDVFDGVIETNLLGAANVARAAVAVFRRQRAGTLVLVGSVLGEAAAPSMTPYVVSKWGVRSLARQLAIENRDLPGLAVALVAPAAVDTPIYRRAANYQGRAPKPPGPTTTPEHVASAVLDALDRPRAVVDVGHGKRLMRWGFRLAPSTYDALAGPLYRLLGVSREPAPPTSGNIHEPLEELEGIRGDDPVRVGGRG
jgi:NAD(P)-dependent dehydrogenase (short-subunit alcohol dehydrogenase family)